MPTLRRVVELLGKAVRKPPRVVADRALAEGRRLWESHTIPRRGSGLTVADMLRDAGVPTVAALVARVSARPYVAAPPPAPELLDALSPGEVDRLRDRAELALRREVDLLGSGVIALGETIDWHRDYKTGHRWDPGFYGAIRYGDPEAGSDVKVPWEISRLQWLIPVAQMYQLTGDERYATAVRGVLEAWIAANPYGASVNWTCTMEVALRILSWTYFFHALHGSSAWRDAAFQERLLLALYEHAHFTEGHLEFSDVNGNHYTADAAGLAFAGLFFGGRGRSARWAERGWRILQAELPRQTSGDGVDFEASVPYHRLVFELFFLPALYRLRQGLEVARPYRERLLAMARFTEAYTLPTGLAPALGDADDARALPFGTQDLNDHRYLVGCAALAWDDETLRAASSGSCAEATWLFGPEAAARLPQRGSPPPASSVAFSDAGYFAMRSGASHIFIDCAPVGLGGRGGHGHNDCLSFTAVLDGVSLVVDSGAYVYTASYAERNRFRSTALHNTPQVGSEEINRFISPTHLWNLHYDAVPVVRWWAAGVERDVFVGSHLGYRRLDPPAEVVRAIVLDKTRAALLVSDVVEGAGGRAVSIPWHLAPGVEARIAGEGTAELRSGGRIFRLDWRGRGWSVALEPSRVSPSYGVVHASTRLVWRSVDGSVPLTTLLRPAGDDSSGEIATNLLMAAGLDLGRWTA